MNQKKDREKLVVWAVDPFEEGGIPKEAVRKMDQWAGKANVRLQPVYVLQLPLKERQRGSLALVEQAQDALQKYAGRFKLKHGSPPQVLIDESDSRHGAVRCVLDHARKYAAAWIVLSSHGRSGLKRMVLGSFAESLLREAKIPVLFMPRNEAWELGSVLFPTDFSSLSRKAFHRFLPIAGKLKLDLVIFHAISYPMPVYMGQMSGIPSAYFPPDYYPRQKAWAHSRGASWVKAARAAGVSARLLLSELDIGLLTGKLILKAARASGSSMIAMASQGGALDRFLVGSAAQDVFRANEFPVWMFGPKSYAARSRAPAPVIPLADRRRGRRGGGARRRASA
jgi:nucleotide-binding universal stress UspA family protein